MSEIDLGPGARRPAEDGERQRDREHPPGHRDRHRQDPRCPPRRTRAPSRRRRPPSPTAGRGRRAKRAAKRGPPGRSRASVEGGEPGGQRDRNAIAIPSTSRSAEARTIGTGDSSRTRNPAPVASPAVAITGPPLAAARRAATAGANPSASRLAEAGLELDRVVDRESDQDRAAPPAKPSSASRRTAPVAPNAIATETRATPSGSSRSGGPKTSASVERHHRQRRREKDEDLAAELLAEPLDHDRDPADDVAAARRGGTRPRPPPSRKRSIARSRSASVRSGRSRTEISAASELGNR